MNGVITIIWRTLSALAVSARQAAVVRTKLKNLLTGATVEKTSAACSEVTAGVRAPSEVSKSVFLTNGAPLNGAPLNGAHH